ncbi:AP-3 complex subunit delta [Ascosphaera acerosa]|nr:AP-3 complex subunit delta [Ascosphaera acerosa]
MPISLVEPASDRKKRGMIVLEGDPNLKYVALLAFNRIARSHPALVAEQQDVILDCLDDEDFSIRAQALDLAAVVVSSDTLEHVVNHLVAQLRESTSPAAAGSAAHGDPAPTGNGGGDAAQKVVLPGYYREKVLERVLDMCSRETYAHVTDFEWYIDVLVQLVKFVPSTRGNDAGGGDTSGGGGGGGGGSGDDDDIATRIGHELLNVAVRVQAVRAEATQAAESLLLVDNRAILFPAHSAAAANVLAHVAFVVGEYAEHLAAPERTLTSLTHPSNHRLPAPVLASFLQAIPKVFVALTVRPQEHQLLKPEEREEEEDDEPSQRHGAWDSVRRGELLLALGRIVSFLEPLAANPDFDVQERAVEFLEMLRLTGEAISAQHAHEVEMPLLVSSILPGLFDGLSLRPVAPAAQAKVPVPEGLDLDAPVNPDLARVLQDAEREWAATTVDEPAAAELYDYYYVPERGRERAGMAGRHAAAATAVEEQRCGADWQTGRTGS